LSYLGGTRARNEVSILIENELTDRVVEVRRKSYCILPIMLVMREKVLIVICVYALQMGSTDDIQKVFWEELEDVL